MVQGGILADANPTSNRLNNTNAARPKKPGEKRNDRLAKCRCRARMRAAVAHRCSPWRQDGAQQGAQHPGRSVVMSKCFQCHTDAMFRDQRQDRRGWEAAIYRMIGRGGLWTQEEIKLMADYLGSDFGPSSKPASAPSR
jgi:hypothetical protein